MGLLNSKTATIAAIAFLTAAPATAAMAASEGMRTKGRTTQPIGHYELCRSLPQECQTITNNPAPVTLSRALWGKVVDVNNTVNSKIFPRTDMEIWGQPEVWSYPKTEGDCEDFALLKRRMLMQAGVPAGSLLITVVRQPNGDGHAVLTFRTDVGDFILDNLTSAVLPWQQTEYRFLKRQSDTNSGRWVSITDTRDVIVGSLRK
jgi:predicted transglutaminase-like cysteine proteinase